MHWQANIDLPLSSVFDAVINLASRVVGTSSGTIGSSDPQQPAPGGPGGGAGGRGGGGGELGYADTADSAVGGSTVYWLGPEGARPREEDGEQEGEEGMERSNTLALTVDRATSRAEALLKNMAK